jgi:hypothetical protein
VSATQSEDPYAVAAPLLKIAEDWLAAGKGANIPLELAFYEMRWREGWRLSISRTPKEVEGVSVVMPGGHWYLECRRQPIAPMLSNVAVVHGRRAATLTTSARVAEWIKPFLLESGGIRAESQVSLLRCTKAPAVREGRWATTADLADLKMYEQKITGSRKKYLDTSWNVLVALKALAVVTRDNSIVSSLRRYGPAPAYAGISDLFGTSTLKDDETGAKLVGFVVSEILSQRKAVYVLVDEGDASGLDLYRRLGFEDQGTFYRAYLE